MKKATKKFLTASEYFEKRFGGKVYKLALSSSDTCPNRDGRVGVGGCTFCAEGSGGFAERGESATEMIERAKVRVSAKIKKGGYIAYFQSFTSTYAPLSRLERLFTEAITRADVVALSVATRPDCLPSDVIELLSRLNAIKPVFVELGLQTMHERTAQAINRCYPLQAYDEACATLRARGINVITHVILGLPGESREDMLDTVRHVCATADGIKLQLLHVLKGTELAESYARGEFETLGMEEYVDIVCDALALLPEGMVVHRITGDAPKRLLVAPLWSADKKKTLNYLTARITERFESYDKNSVNNKR